MTPSQIRQAYESHNEGSRHFFDRATMRFFGDTMRSYGARRIDGVVYLYRKPEAMVNVFGKHRRTGRQFFNCWRFDTIDGDLHHCREDETARVWQALFGQEG